MNHTPGPWHWDSDGFLWSRTDPQFEVGNAGAVYQKADRDLIAAAPEMFDALVKIDRILSETPGINLGIPAICRSAIAKARGL